MRRIRFTRRKNSSIPPQPVFESAGVPNFFYNSNISDTFTINYPDPATGIVQGSLELQSSRFAGCPLDGANFNQCYFVTLQGIRGTPYSLNTFPDGTTNLSLPSRTYVLTERGERVPGQDSTDVYHVELNYTEFSNRIQQVH